MGTESFRVHFRTFGCKANQYDTERMRQELEALGAAASERAEAAALCVVNTCTVTNQADADARRFIRRLRRENPDIRVVVAGCSSALKPHVYREMEGVVAVVEGHDPGEVARAALVGLGKADVARPPGGASAPGGAYVPGGASVPGGPSAPDRPGPPAPLVQLGVARNRDPIDDEPVGGELLNRRVGGTRGWLKVQDGCDRKCSFCATRLARGRSRSRPPEEVLAEARLLARNHPELVVTGIHIGHYGRDLPERTSLSRLLALLLDALPGVRLRLGSVEATEVDDVLLDLLATSGGALAPHLHMPMQSGSDAVLGRMRRWHTRDQYRRRALEIAGAVGPLGLGADIITGFPGETEADHAGTRELVEALPFTYLHVFPFSPRDDTVAAGLPDPVPQRVAGERSRELRELGMEKGRAHRASRSGEGARVVLEGNGGWALTGDYLRVAVRGQALPADSLHDGRLREEGEHLVIDLSPDFRLIQPEPSIRTD